MNPGKIIFLNGTSSSGKTSLLKAFQSLCPEPYLDMGIDRFIWMLPKRYLNRPLWDDVLGLASQAGQTGHQLVSAMHQAIAAAALSGMNIIADHVLVEPDWVADCAARFHQQPAWLVGVRCPLEIVEAREKARNDRTLGQARAQYIPVHAHGLYDLEINTAQFTPEEGALQILAHLQNGSQPFALKKIFENQAGLPK